MWAEIVRLLPPTSMECMAVPIWTVRRWISGQSIDRYRDADVTVADANDDQRKASDKDLKTRTVLRWRGSGDQNLATSDANSIRPGDTVVISVTDGGWDIFGNIPNAPSTADLEIWKRGSDFERREVLQKCISIDVAEACCRSKNLRHVVRLHAAFPQRASLRSLAMSDLRKGLDELAEQEFGGANGAELLASIKNLIRKGFDRHRYPSTDPTLVSDEAVIDEVIYLRKLLPKQAELELPSPDHDDEDDDRSQSNLFVSLPDHTMHVVERITRSTAKLGTPLDSAFILAAKWHDLGKADLRFQAMLAGLTPSEITERSTQLAKSAGRRLTTAERLAVRKRSLLPIAFRHEFVSSQLVHHVILTNEDHQDVDRDIVLRLIESHHGYARPFATVVLDCPTLPDNQSSNIAFGELRSISLRLSEYWPEIEVDSGKRDDFVPLHRLNSGVVDRFWKLTRRFGWWGLAYFESILRLADQRASAAEEQEEK